MAIQQFYTPKKLLYPPKQISGYAPGNEMVSLSAGCDNGNRAAAISTTATPTT